MADHLQEEEQLEAISQWWQENRTSVIAAVVLTLGAPLAGRSMGLHQREGGRRGEYLRWSSTGKRIR